LAIFLPVLAQRLIAWIVPAERSLSPTPPMQQRCGVNVQLELRAHEARDREYEARDREYIVWH
jgi:hypothetical protein